MGEMYKRDQYYHQNHNMGIRIPLLRTGTAGVRGPKDRIDMRILQTMMFGIPLILGLGTRISNPCVSFWAPRFGN